jgi:hypothetical protein
MFQRIAWVLFVLVSLPAAEASNLCSVADLAWWRRAPEAPVDSPEAKAYCESGGARHLLKSRLMSAEGKTAFQNQGGLPAGFHRDSQGELVLDTTATCWWHSRMQRKSALQTIFLPDQPKPTRDQVEMIVRSLRDSYRITAIPGYANWNAFTRDWETVIQEKLDHWELCDTLAFKFLKGLQGKSSGTADEVWDLMTGIHRRVAWHYKDPAHPEAGVTLEGGMVETVMLQLSGVTAHAWNVVDSVVKNDCAPAEDGSSPQGYSFKVIDSNDPGNLATVDYCYGDTSVHVWYGQGDPVWSSGFLLYPFFEKEVDQLIEHRRDFCKRVGARYDGR